MSTIFMNIAHRGASCDYPENTVLAFQKALNITKYLECDIRFTNDGEIVLMHDLTVDRTTNGKGLVSDFTLEEIKALDAGSWLDEQFTGVRVPTLAEVMEALPDDANLVIEMKDGIRFPSIIDKTVSLIIQQEHPQRFGISSFHWDILKRVRELDQTIQLSALVSYTPTGVETWRADGKEIRSYDDLDALIRDARTHGVEIICPKASQISEEFVERLHSEGFLVRAWAVQGPDEAEMRRLIRCKANGMTTDYPALLQRIYEEEQL